VTIAEVASRVCACGVYVATTHPHNCSADLRARELAEPALCPTGLHAEESCTPAGRAFGGDRCEAYPQPFARCNHAALWTIELDVTGDDGKVRERWEYVAACRTHKDTALAMVLARLASNRAAVLRITPTDRNGETL
jgi:hypothetical protein